MRNLMNKIDIVRDYVLTIDSLDGKELESGESIKVQWKDGTVTTEKINVQETVTSYYGHNDCGEVIVKQAYVTKMIYGTSFICYLNQAGILCERI
jgi:hypothetical protein